MNNMHLNRLNRMKPLRGLRLIDADSSIDMNALMGKFGKFENNFARRAFISIENRITNKNEYAVGVSYK